MLGIKAEATLGSQEQQQLKTSLMYGDNIAF